MKFTFGKTMGTAVVMLSFGFGMGSFASSGASSSATTFYACLKGGSLSKVSSTSHTCPKGFTVASWGITGPRGMAGDTGPQGPAGADGAPATLPSGDAFVGRYFLEPSAYLAHADLASRDIEGVDANHAYLAVAGFSHSTLTNDNFTGADFTGADLSNVIFSGTRMKGAILTNASLSGASAPGVDFSHGSLRGADLTQANLSGALLYDVDMTGATVTDANFLGAGMDGSTICPNGLHFGDGGDCPSN